MIAMSMTVQEDTSDAAAEFAHMRRTLALLVSAQEGVCNPAAGDTWPRL